MTCKTALSGFLLLCSGGGIALHGAVNLLTDDFGSSLIPIGAGPRAMGMGGAFVAIADDATANTWNPGGMTQLERPEVAFSFGYYGRQTQLLGVSAWTQEADLDHVSGVLPFHAGFQQTLAVAWQRQFDFSKQFSFRDFSDTTNGFGIRSVTDNAINLDQSGAFSSLGASYAIEPLPNLSLGVTGFVWGDKLTGHSNYHQRRSLIGTSRTSTSGFPDTVLFTDNTVDTDVTVRKGYSLAVGIWWLAYPDLTFAATVKPAYTLTLERHQTVREYLYDVGMASVITNRVTTSDAISTLRYPPSATLAAAWRYLDSRTFALDLTWTRWREMRTTTGGMTTSPINPYVAPADFPDTFSLRAGYEQIVVFPGFISVPRCGLLYEGLPGVTIAPNGAQADQVSPKTDHYYGATIGLSVFQRTVLYDAACQFRFGRGVGAGLDSSPTDAANVRTITARLGLTYQF